MTTVITLCFHCVLSGVNIFQMLKKEVAKLTGNAGICCLACYQPGTKETEGGICRPEFLFPPFMQIVSHQYGFFS